MPLLGALAWGLLIGGTFTLPLALRRSLIAAGLLFALPLLALFGTLVWGALLAGRLVAFRVITLTAGSVALAGLFGLARPFVGGGVLAFAAGTMAIGFLPAPLLAAAGFIAPLRAIGVGFALAVSGRLRLLLVGRILLLVRRLLAISRSDLLRLGGTGLVHSFLPCPSVPLGLLARAALGIGTRLTVAGRLLLLLLGSWLRTVSAPVLRLHSL